MPTTTDLLSIIEEEETIDVGHLAKKLGLHTNQLKEILEHLSKHNLVEYNQKTGMIRPPSWLIDIDTKIEGIKPATGTIILPKYQEIKLQDLAIGNFTDNDLELNMRLNGKQKEIAICKVGYACK
jgi:hypothetical protein